ncbi:MAG: GDP-L-fucose synthase [Candidatus Omnitrophica bacterium]|nr:GDP-L-fucose synthase [Candidatus Omnitrophota bacterium]
MDKNSKIFVVGHNDIIENSLVEYFEASGYTHIISSSKIGINTTIQASVYGFFASERPDYVFLGSTRSGGIEANQKMGAEFMYHNLESQNNIIYAAQKFGVKKLLYLAGSCVYPKVCDQPMKEEYIGTGKMEETSEAYSLAKLAGIKLAQMFHRQYGLNAIVAIPPTVYGPGSDVNLETAHVMGALIGKFANAMKNNQPEVVIWGTGNPRREFLFKDDFAQACSFLMEHYDEEAVINIGCGSDVSIKDLASLIANAAGFKGKLVFDSSKPDGAMRKLLDNSRIAHLGWKAKKELKEGIKETYQWFLNKKKE